MILSLEWRWFGLSRVEWEEAITKMELLNFFFWPQSSFRSSDCLDSRSDIWVQFHIRFSKWVRPSSKRSATSLTPFHSSSHSYTQSAYSSRARACDSKDNHTARFRWVLAEHMASLTLAKSGHGIRSSWNGPSRRSPCRCRLHWNWKKWSN